MVGGTRVRMHVASIKLYRPPHKHPVFGRPSRLGRRKAVYDTAKASVNDFLFQLRNAQIAVEVARENQAGIGRVLRCIGQYFVGLLQPQLFRALAFKVKETYLSRIRSDLPWPE